MRTRRWLLPAAGVLLVVIGIIVAATTPSEVSFGWFAYAPLSETMFSPVGTMVVPPGQATAGALIVLGLLVLAFCAGWLLARRRPRTARGASGQGS
ncbi:hypothetical protein HRK28_10245 [Rathayibacter sp. VKM Ac-2835]|uniref:hypothetical protein n=1 Tax=Rathayibacter sp. VKM Ac-2835 TaxID=2739043 RepID=UPI0015662591|nr:hypothetical protein [Rathayibacter sp. VKM Ac-2835]NRG41300.1 hypothetical protein [Rathayibacter sp. VKM Ac-2835]